MFCVDYSEKAVALFGNTALVQDHLKLTYGARFNPKLSNPDTGQQAAGWIISKKHSAAMLKDLNITMVSTSTQPRPSASSSSSLSSPVASARVGHGNASSDKKQEAAEGETSSSSSSSSAPAPLPLPPMYVVNYSEKACAVFGQTKAAKQALSDLGGKWNKNLKDRLSSGSDGGWIFSKKRREAIIDALQIPLLGGEGPGAAASPAPAPAPAPASSSSSEAAPSASSKKTAEALDAAVEAELDRLRRGIEYDLHNTREEHRVAVPSLSQDKDKDKDTDQGRAKTAPTPTPSSSSSSSSSRDTAVVAGTGARAGLYAVHYSDKCLAVFGNTKAVKETLKTEFAGRFNAALNDPTTGAKAAGWIVLSKFKEDLKKWLLGADGAAAAAAVADANPPKKRSAATGSDEAGTAREDAKRKTARYNDDDNDDDDDDDDDDDEPLVRR